MKICIWSLLIMALCIPSYADDTVVARVNNGIITVSDLEAEVDLLIPRATFHGNVSEEKREEYRDKALEVLIDRLLQYQDAVARGFKPDKNAVRDDMKRIRNSFETRKEYDKALDKEGMTEDELRKKVEKGVLVRAVTAKTITEPARMSDDALKDYYQKNVGKFRQPESVKLSLISIKDGAKAKEALAKIKSGKNFGAVAAKMSEDQYRIMGGDIGYIHRGRTYSEIEDVAFRLKAGEISDLIQADNLYFIIKVEDKRPEIQMSYDESKDKLKKELEKKRSDELMEKWMAELRSKAKIEILLKTSEGGRNIPRAR